MTSESNDPMQLAQAAKVLGDHVAAGATPGATAVVARGGGTVATLAEGRHTYSAQSRTVSLTDRYDLASLTKLVTTTACLLLEEDGSLELGDPVQTWVSEYARDGREAVTIQHLLAHCSGLPAHRPLSGTCNSAEAFLRAICEMPLESAPGTTTAYSDLGFILLGSVLERASGTSLEPLLVERVLQPLGMTYTTFNPSVDSLDEIPPTEVSIDGLIHGQVHDDNARAMGGVAPHAGLFGPASDMARLVSAYLCDGQVGSKQVLPAGGVRRYVERANLVEGSTRALGWDTVSETGSSAGKRFSTRAFGHLGFTGTSVWADPETGLAVVLLTNRVHPTRVNEGIKKLRPAFHDAVMEDL